MMKVFIAGSRQITRLPAKVKIRVDTMIDKGFQILVGDANGADRAVQSYLAEKAYPHVLVHCMEYHCRNNVGRWPTHEVPAPKGARGFDFYSAKDRVTADAAEYGLMLWDGRSMGTINNVVNLSREGKPVVVYIAPKKRFLTVKAFDDLDVVLAEGEAGSVWRISKQLRIKDARREYESIRAAVGAAIDAADPIGLLRIGAPPDEYEPEIGTIVPRVAAARSQREVQEAVHGEFARWFGTDIAGPVDSYDEPARAIWDAVLQFRRQGGDWPR